VQRVAPPNREAFESRLEGRSDLLGPSLLFLTLRHNGAAKAGTEVVGEFVELRIAVDFDGFFGCIADHVAVVAPSQVILEF
jgi:hypothetical protein